MRFHELFHGGNRVIEDKAQNTAVNSEKASPLRNRTVDLRLTRPNQQVPATAAQALNSQNANSQPPPAAASTDQRRGGSDA